MATVRILVLYDSHGHVAELAHSVVAGVEAVDGAEAWDRPLAEAEAPDLVACDGLVLGSPNWTGITGKLKEWLDHTGDLWESGELAGKPGAAFTASYSRSGGTEATLWQLLHVLLGHGMIVVGLPWSDTMRRAGSYYGASAHGIVTEPDRRQAQALGSRVARVALRLQA